MLVNNLEKGLISDKNQQADIKCVNAGTAAGGPSQFCEATIGELY